MHAVVPAAGRGSRLGALTDDQSKGLVTVAGRPLLAWVFERAVEAGADELVVVIGYEGARIVDRLGDRFGAPRYIYRPARGLLLELPYWNRPRVSSYCSTILSHGNSSGSRTQ